VEGGVAPGQASGALDGASHLVAGDNKGASPAIPLQLYRVFDRLGCRRFKVLRWPQKIEDFFSDFVIMDHCVAASDSVNSQPRKMLRIPISCAH
jgi:hypothetical protein